MLEHIQVETTNFCNAHCVFCVHDRFKKFETMPDWLYEKIIIDCSGHKLSTFSPMMTGEPFCDPHMPERLKFARQMMPDVELVLFTNGSIITKEHIDLLAEIKNLKLLVSLNGATKETRYKLMGLNDFDEVCKKIDYMYSVGIEPTLTMAWFPTITVEEINAFAKFKHNRPVRFQNWAGVFYRYNRYMPTRCVRATAYMTIQRNGDVCLCCYDAFAQIKFGSLKEQTIDEVWDSPLHQEYLQAHLENRGQEMKLCQSCTESA